MGVKVNVSEASSGRCPSQICTSGKAPMGLIAVCSVHCGNGGEDSLGVAEQCCTQY